MRQICACLNVGVLKLQACHTQILRRLGCVNRVGGGVGADVWGETKRRLGERGPS